MYFAFSSDSRWMLYVKQGDKRISVEGLLTVIDDEKQRSIPKESYFIEAPTKSKDPAFYMLSTVKTYTVHSCWGWEVCTIRPVCAFSVCVKNEEMKKKNKDVESITFLNERSTPHCSFRESTYPEGWFPQHENQ